MFKNRRDAGRQLGEKLDKYAFRKDVVILGLPRGGVPVAFEVATRLHAPMDVFTVRKLGVPGQAELAMGAIATGDVLVLNEEIIQQLRISDETIRMVAEREAKELDRRIKLFKGDRPNLALENKTVIVVDDGLATGASMKAAVQAVKLSAPAKIIVAVPVGAEETCNDLKRLADDVICALIPDSLDAVGLWYEDFAQTSDHEVQHLLAL